MQFSKYKHGGDEEDRTPDPLRARQVLSQLSYTPIFIRVLQQTLKIEQRVGSFAGFVQSFRDYTISP